MIEILRRFSGSIVAKILLGLLLFGLAAFGLEGALRGGGSSSVATVGDDDIGVAEYQRALGEEVRRLGAGADPAMLRALGVDRVVLARLAAQKALASEARALGFDADDATVLDLIRRDPTFAGASGGFDRAYYERWIEQSGWRRPSEFEADLRDRIAGSILIELAAAGGAEPRAAVEAVWRRANETRDVAWARLPESAAPAPAEPDEPTLRAFHEAQAALFTAPERRRVRVLHLRAADRADPASAPEAEIAARYAARAAEYDKPERRNLEQLVFESRAEATAAAARIAAGERFAKIAAERGVADAGLALGYVSKDEIAAFQPEVAEAAFAAPAPADGADGVVGPFETPRGWSLVNVAGVSPGEVTPLAAVRDTLAREIAEEAARAELPETAHAIEDRRAAGLTLVEIAEAEGASIAEGVIDAEGRDEAGAAPAFAPLDPEFARRVFETDVGVEADLVETPPGDFYAYDVLDIAPASLRPFDEARDAVRSAWIAAERRAGLERLANGLLETIAAARTAAPDPAARGRAARAAAEAALEPFGAALVDAPGLRRDAAAADAAADLAASTVAELFAAPAENAPGSAVTAALDGGAARLVAIVTAVTQADPTAETASAEIDALARRRADTLSADLAALVQGALVDAREVRIDTAAMSAVLGPSQ